MNYLYYYLIVINVLGFILFCINTFLYNHTSDKEIDSLLTLTSILGGSLGILISIILVDRKAVKGNMMSRVFVICVLIIQIVIFFMIKNFDWKNLYQNIHMFYSKYKYLIFYFFAINIIAFIAYGVDKYNAIHRKTRIRIVTLLFIAFIGGSLGALSAMYIFRHKTNKDYFAVGVPLIICTQIIVIIYLLSL